MRKFATIAAMLLMLTAAAWRHVIHSPAQALFFMALGVLAGCLEFAWPGRYVAGAVGAAMFLLGAAALSTFKLTLEGLTLLLLAALALILHARGRFFWLPLAAATGLLAVGLSTLTVPPVSAGVALALALPV